LKKDTPHIKVAQGDGFPSKVFFNGEECALPNKLPIINGATRSPSGVLPAIFLSAATFLLLSGHLN